MKQTLSKWTQLHSSGGGKSRLLHLALMLICMLATAQAGWADTTVSATQFSTSQSGTTYTVSARSGYGDLTGITVKTEGANGGVGSNRLKVPNGTLKIDASSGNVIKSVTITWRNESKNYPTADAQWTSNPSGVSTSSQTSTWTGSSSSVTFTNTTTNTFQIEGLSVTYGPNGGGSTKTDLAADDFKWSATTYTATIGGSNTFPTLTKPENVDVTYSATTTADGNTASDVASIDESGNITLSQAGTAYIKAAFAGNSSYNAKTVTYTLTVNAAAATVDAPTFNPASGTIAASTNNVTVTYPSGATLYTRWSGNSGTYSATDMIAEDFKNTTGATGSQTEGTRYLYAIAVKDGVNSAITEQEYTVTCKPTLALSSTSMSLNTSDNTSATSTITATNFKSESISHSNLTYTVSSNDENVATATVNQSTGVVTVTAVGAGTATITVGNTAGGVYLAADAVTISVTVAAAANVAPTITAQPTGATYTQNATATALSVTATGTPTPTYQWYSNDEDNTTTPTELTGETNSTYTPSTSTVGTTYYYCVVSNSAGTVPSDIVGVTVNAAVDFATPVLSTAGKYIKKFKVQITNKEDGVTYTYSTTNASGTPTDPDDPATAFPDGGLELSDAKNYKVKVSGTKDGVTKTSEVYLYNCISSSAVTLTITPATGTYTGAQNVTITKDVLNGIVRYGTRSGITSFNASTSDTQYNDGDVIVISTTSSVAAKIWDDNGSNGGSTAISQLTINSTPTLSGAFSPTSASVEKDAAAPSLPTYTVTASNSATLDGTEYTVSMAVSGTSGIVTLNAGGTAIESISTSTVGTATVTATLTSTNTSNYTVPTATATYTITVNAPATVSAINKADTENGSFTVKVGGSEVTEATSGAKVTVTTTPNEGYEVDAVTLSTSGTVTKESTNNYTFTMPASAVTVTVTFKESTSTKATAPTITYTLSDGVTITNSGTTYTIINPNNKDQKVKVFAKKGTYVRYTSGNTVPENPTKSKGTEVNGLSNDKESSSGISVSKNQTVFYIKAIAFTDKNGSNPSDIVLFTFNTRKAELDDPTITQNDGNTFKEGEATKHATFKTNADGATTYYVIGNEAKTKASDITSDTNKHPATGSSEEIDLSSFVTAEKDVVISAVSEKDGKYSEIVTTTYTYNGTKTYTVVTNNPIFQIGQRDEVLITNIKDKNGNKILFGQEEGATIDYSQYFNFTYALATNAEAQAFDASITDNAANKNYVVSGDISTSVIQSKAESEVEEEQLPKSFIVKVTATPIGDATNYVKDASVVAYAKVTVKKKAYTGIGYAKFYWDIERTSKELVAGTDYRVVTDGDLKGYGVFDEGMSVPNGRVIFLKVADDETVDGKTWHHSRDVDHFCYYYGSSKLGNDKAVSDVQYYNSSTKVYRNNLIPLLISSNNSKETKTYVDNTTESGKNILWVTVQGYEADGSQYGSPIKMKIYITENERPAGPTYDPSENKAVRNTAQTVAANGTGTSDVFAKFSSESTNYHELELIHEEGIMRGRNNVGVFSTEVAARKITGSQVTKVGDYYYLSNQSRNVYNYRFATTLKMDQDAYYVNVGDEFNAPTITGTYFDKIKKQNINIDLSGKLSYSYTNSNGADDTKVNETTGVVYTDASGSTENNKIGTKSGTVVVTVKFTSDKTKTITVNDRTSVLDDAEIKYTINIVDPAEHTATISPLSRKFAGSQVVKIEADDEWDTYYTTNGDEPTATDIKIPAGTAVNITVGGDIEIGQSVVVKAKPFNGSAQGKLVSETYEKVQPIAAPTFVPDGTGEPYYYTTKTPMEETKNRIEIRTTTAGASVYYMIDNPKVTTASNLYDGLSKVYINFNSASSHTIYAFAYKDGVQSEIVSSTYRYTTNIDVPVFHANGNNYSEGSANVNKDDEITITGPTGSTIYYTLDGTDPSVSNGQKYESSFNIFKTTTAKAVAIDGDATSKITTVVFNVPTPAKDDNDFWEAVEETTPNGKLAVADRRISLIKNGDVYAYNSVKAVKGITATFGGKDNQGWAEANILEASLGSIIDGVGKYNIRNENEPKDEIDNAFTPLTTSKTTTHERTFGLPAQGCFVRFEPTEDGQLTIWTMQQGALHYTNSNDNRTLCSRIIRFRPVYMIDEQGKSLTAENFESTARLSADWSKLETDNWLPNDGSEENGEKSIYTTGQSAAIYNLINTELGTKVAGDAIAPILIEGNNTLYTTLYGAAPSNDLKGYIMPSGGYVKYTFNLKAGKSYYFFGNNSRVCVRGFRYVIDSSAATEDVTLDDTGDNGSISSSCNTTTDNVTITNRTFAANKWTALLLPFSMSATQVEQTFGENTRVIHFEKYENYKLYWKNHYYDMIVAGTPILIYPTKEATISGLKVQIESTEANDPTGDGTYTFNGTYNRGTLNKWNIFVNNQGVTKQWTGNNGQAYKSLRAWLTGFSSAAKARSAIIGLDDNEEENVTTGIYEIPFEGTDAGDTFAKGNNNVYSVSGMLIRKNATSLEGLPAGVYIINGKKVVIND